MAMSMANGVLYNELRLANATPEECTTLAKRAFGLKEDTVLPSLDPKAIVQARHPGSLSTDVQLVHLRGREMAKIVSTLVLDLNSMNFCP
jgi:hypothetical protein